MMKKNIASFLLLFVLCTPMVNAQDAVSENQSSKESERLKALEVLPSDMRQGSEDAKVTIIEYSSLSCPHCATFHEKIYKNIKKDYVDKGLVYYIYRDYPANHPALIASMISHCSGRDRYFQYLDLFFSSQDQWAFDMQYKKNLQNIAKLAGFNSFESCISDKELEDKLINQVLQGSKYLEIDATPTIIINGKNFHGVKSYDYFKDIIDSLIAKEENASQVEQELPQAH